MRAVYLEGKKDFIENESMQLSFLVKDFYNDVIANAALANYKFNMIITDGTTYQIIKEDANYTDGSANEIAVSGNKVIVYVDENETEDWAGDFGIELYMVHKTTGNNYLIYSDTFSFRLSIIKD